MVDGPGSPSITSMVFAPVALAQKVETSTAWGVVDVEALDTSGSGGVVKPWGALPSGKHGCCVSSLQQARLTPPFASTQTNRSGATGSGSFETQAAPVHSAPHPDTPHWSAWGGTPVGSPAAATHGVGPTSGVAVPVVSGAKLVSSVATGELGMQVDDRSYWSERVGDT